MPVTIKRSVLFVLISSISVFVVSQADEATSAEGKVETAPVRVVHAKGSHYDAGYQIGTALKSNLVSEVQAMKQGAGWAAFKAEADLFLQYSKTSVPEYVAEVQGAADAAGLELDEVFATLCEEIGDSNYSYSGGCSDLIASDDVTRDGAVLVAHNNDTSASIEDDVTIIHYEVEGEPEIVAVGYGGLGISVGYNSAGISLTGNQLNSNDMRPGVPRMLLVRKILAAETVGDAIDAAILQPRASNYNQVISDRNGEIYSIEGSATDYEPIYALNGYLVHTNHYTSAWMRRYEHDPQQITSSLVRYNRGTRLMKNHVGEITVESLMEFLSDHVNRPRSICRHGDDVKTTFSVVINLDTLVMFLARGNPCEAAYHEYALLAGK